PGFVETSVKSPASAPPSESAAIARSAVPLLWIVTLPIGLDATAVPITLLKSRRFVLSASCGAIVTSLNEKAMAAAGCAVIAVVDEEVEVVEAACNARGWTIACNTWLSPGGFSVTRSQHHRRE